ncbi:MAG: hypothetical protein CSA81_03965 [Acidobacteria bacterium]|nr:MAG: hypothetical protein CSA81_03965 [Acidobacteriota bacterium]
MTQTDITARQMSVLANDKVIQTFLDFLVELDVILQSPQEIIESSFYRMGLINDEILEFARKVEIEMIRIIRTPANTVEVTFAKVLVSDEVKMAFDLIMGDFVDRVNYLPEKIKSDIDDTVGKLRNFIKHTTRDLAAVRLGLGDEVFESLFVKLYYNSLAKEIKVTNNLLNMIIQIQTKLRKSNLTPQVFHKMRAVFAKNKLVSPVQWKTVGSVLTNMDRFFLLNVIEKKYLMRCTDYFELNKKICAFSALTKAFIQTHEALAERKGVHSDSDYKPLVTMAQQFEGILMDLGSFLEFLIYEVSKRECLNYSESFKRETEMRKRQGFI